MREFIYKTSVIYRSLPARVLNLILSSIFFCYVLKYLFLVAKLLYASKSSSVCHLSSWATVNFSAVVQDRSVGRNRPCFYKNFLDTWVLGLSHTDGLKLITR